MERSAFIDDGIDALLRIIENKDNCAKNKIYNVGHPKENVSIRSLAILLIDLIKTHYPAFASRANQTKLISIEAKNYYGDGYQDVVLRVPAIQNAQRDLNWNPKTDLKTGLQKMLSAYSSHLTALSITE